MTQSFTDNILLKKDNRAGVLVNEQSKIDDWCLQKSINKGEDYYVIVKDIKVLQNPDGTKLYIGYGEKKSIYEYREKKINELINEL